MYVGLENADELVAIDTNTNRVVARSRIGEAPQAMAYVTNAVAEGDGRSGLQPSGTVGAADRLFLVAAKHVQGANDEYPTSVSLFDQGLTQIVEAAVSGLAPGTAYVLALSAQSDGGGPLQSLSAFTTNPAGAAIVNAVGPIRQIVQATQASSKRYLVIASGTPSQIGPVVQIQSLPPANGGND